MTAARRPPPLDAAARCRCPPLTVTGHNVADLPSHKLPFDLPRPSLLPHAARRMCHRSSSLPVGAPPPACRLSPVTTISLPPPKCRCRSPSSLPMPKPCRVASLHRAELATTAGPLPLAPSFFLFVPTPPTALRPHDAAPPGEAAALLLPLREATTSLCNRCISSVASTQLRPPLPPPLLPSTHSHHPSYCPPKTRHRIRSPLTPMPSTMADLHGRYPEPPSLPPSSTAGHRSSLVAGAATAASCPSPWPIDCMPLLTIPWLPSPPNCH